MPFALIIIGLLLIVAGARGTYPQLKTLLVSDFTGQKNFINWIIAIGAVGLIGYVPALEKFSRVFLALIVISIFLAERGFFAKFSDAIKNFQPSPSSTAPSKASVGEGSVLGAIDGATGSNAIGSIVSGFLGK